MSTDNIATKLDELLQRCDAIKPGSEIDMPVYLYAAGEAHAAAVAARDRGVGRFSETLAAKPLR